jgi:hypothetical protein
LFALPELKRKKKIRTANLRIILNIRQQLEQGFQGFKGCSRVPCTLVKIEDGESKIENGVLRSSSRMADGG